MRVPESGSTSPIVLRVPHDGSSAALAAAVLDYFTTLGGIVTSHIRDATIDIINIELPPVAQAGALQISS